MDVLVGLFFAVVLTALCVFALAHGQIWLFLPFGSILLFATLGGLGEGIAEYRRLTEER